VASPKIKVDNNKIKEKINKNKVKGLKRLRSALLKTKKQINPIKKAAS